MPISRVTPLPKRIDETAISKAMSLLAIAPMVHLAESCRAIETAWLSPGRGLPDNRGMDVTIKQQPEVRVGTVRHIGPYDKISQAFERLAKLMAGAKRPPKPQLLADRKSTRLNSSHSQISYAV